MSFDPITYASVKDVRANLFNQRPLRIQKVLNSSGTIVAPITGFMELYVVGGNGSGGATRNSSSGGATGGGAGEYVTKKVPVVMGEVYTGIIGAGGAGSVGINGIAVAGNDGGDTTVTGAGVNIVAKGGKRGNSSTSLGGLGLLGGLGGSGGSGGDFHFAGGNGGNISPGYTFFAATGGGAVGIFENSPEERRGGNVYAVNSKVIATGGAGVGGTGGDVPVTATGLDNSFTFGGGSGGSAKNLSASYSSNTSLGPNFLQEIKPETPLNFPFYGFLPIIVDVFGGGGGNGGGTQGHINNGTVPFPVSTLFCGGGGSIGIGGSFSKPVVNSGLGSSGGSLNINNITTESSSAGSGIIYAVFTRNK